LKYAASKHLSNDIKAGVTVFLVAIPLCLGIALASGAPVISGMIAGIIGGIIVGALSGSPLSVSGPAAGLVAVVLAAITALGSFQIFLLAVVFSGIIQIVLGYFKAGIIAHYIPYSVIKGMLAAIGIILIFKQVPHAFGYDNNFEGSLSFSQEGGSNTLSEFSHIINHISFGAIIITLISFFCLYLFSLKSF
jgi:MFS superfamily sulfate permease-like transporter